MSWEPPVNPNPQGPNEFASVCRAMDLSVLTLDLNGQPTEDPDTSPNLMIWMCSAGFRSVLMDCAQEWASQETPKALAHESGVVLFPHAQRYRERRNGLIVLAGFTERILESDLLQSSGLDPLELSSIKHALKKVAKPWDAMIEQVETALNALYLSESQRDEDITLVESYTNQLSDSYEIITAMHMLGREMGSVENADAFLSLSADLIAATLNYAWVGFLLDNDEIGYIQHGDEQLDETDVLNHLDDLTQDEPITACDGVVVYEARGIFENYGPQVLLHPLNTANRRFGTILVCGKQGNDSSVSTHDTKTIDSIAGIVSSFLESMSLYTEQRTNFLGFIRALSNAIDAKDPYTQGHSTRVAMLAQQLALRAGYAQHDADRVRLCGVLHDIGKIGIPESVLRKDSKLTDDEFDLIKTHPTLGANMLSDIDSLSDIIPGVLHHHERWDGRGYPSGLEADHIPEIARILALADTFDAMSSNRSYRQARSREEVLEEIQRNSGTQFDPELVPLFLSLDFSAFDEMISDHQSQSSHREAA